MRNFTPNKWLLAATFLLMPLVATAAGLGRLAVLSSLGQPLDAEIELLSIHKKDAGNLHVRLASPDDYRRANLQYSPALTGMRLAVRARSDGKYYIKVTSRRPVSEPFIDLLIELDWASGRLTRDYTALIDPPGYVPTQARAPAPTMPESRPAPAPPAPTAAVAPAKPIEGAGAVAGGARQYGPIRRGETLYSIARKLKPGDVTLEQMLVGLYRTNPDAFMKNMNRMKTGKILRVPEAEKLKSVSEKEAVSEFHAQVSDWNAYRQALAGAAGTAPKASAAASGKITSRVEEKGAGGVKDVVRLSKGEPATGAAGKRAGGEEQVQALQEELIAREKALKEANDRIAQLNQTLEDLQKKLEIKSEGMAAAQQQAETQAEMKKPEPSAAPETKKGAPEAAGKPSQSKPAPKPKPKPKKVAPPPPPPEPSLIDTILGEPMYLAAGAGVILLGLLALVVARRRRAQAPAGEDAERAAPSLSEGVSDEKAETAASTAPAEAEVAAGAATLAEEIDPLDEAEVYITHGRDQQAEVILKEAIAKNPNRPDIQLKLLEVYAARKDRPSFDAAADKFNQLTGGAGADWLRVAAMGYALSPDNPAYAAGKEIAEAAESTEAAPSNLDFEVASSATPSTPMVEMPEEETVPPEPETAASATPDVTVEVPDAGSPAATDIAVEPEPEPSSTIDFNIELPSLDDSQAPAEQTAAPAQEDSGKDGGLDFNIDLPNMDLNLDEKPAAGAASGEEKDAHWYDVQTKFDLVRAYQEIGEKDGARQLLQEVLEEGDAQQRAEAQKLLDSLG